MTMDDHTLAPPQAAEPKATFYSWYALAVLVVVYIMNYLDRQIMSILVVDIQKSLHVSNQTMGFLGGAAFAVFYSLFGIPLGRLADNISRTRLLAFGLALWSTMTMLSGFARNSVQLSATRMGVGVGEASGSPSAYSLISDYFPKRQRATALAIYSSGLYIGGGASLWVGATISKAWDTAYPLGGPLGLVGWQAAFVALGPPGLLVALWVLSLREPRRGAMDGLQSQEISATPFRDLIGDMSLIGPPFTFWGAARRGAAPFAVNVGAAVLLGLCAAVMMRVTGNVPQWLAVAVGFYATFSWASALRSDDPSTFRLIFGSRAFVFVALAFGLNCTASLGMSYWAAPYAETVLKLPKDQIAFYLGGGAATAGFLGVIIGGHMADRLRARFVNGRIIVIIFSLVAPTLPAWITYTTLDGTTFYVAYFVAAILSAGTLAASAAATQDLVLPHMRGTAAAALSLATTLVGLGFGPYLVGLISELAGTTANGVAIPNLRTGILSMLLINVPALILLIAALRLVAAAEASIIERAAEASARSDVHDK